jgi:hypothetical protein
MEINLPRQQTITIRPIEQVVVDKISVTRILDDPINKKVIVWMDPVPTPVELTELSNENYDNPEWTNEKLKECILKIMEGIS